MRKFLQGQEHVNIKNALKYIMLTFFIGCGLMNGKIYCYGGDLYSTATAHSPNNGMNVLDLTNSSGKLATDLQNMWRPVSYNINNVDLTSRIDPQCIVLEGGKQMIVNGGFDSTRPGHLANLNIVYDVDKNQWNAMPDYEEPPYGRRQMYLYNLFIFRAN